MLESSREIGSLGNLLELPGPIFTAGPAGRGSCIGRENMSQTPVFHIGRSDYRGWMSLRWRPTASQEPSSPSSIPALSSR